MRTLFVALLYLFITTQAQAADVVCSCKGETKCSDIKISFVPSNPGVYMTIEYAYGKRDLEGFASIYTDSELKETRYHLDNFILIEKEGKYSLPGKPAQCN